MDLLKKRWFQWILVAILSVGYVAIKSMLEPQSETDRRNAEISSKIDQHLGAMVEDADAKRILQIGGATDHLNSLCLQRVANVSAEEASKVNFCKCASIGLIVAASDKLSPEYVLNLASLKRVDDINVNTWNSVTNECNSDTAHFNSAYQAIAN